MKKRIIFELLEKAIKGADNSSAPIKGLIYIWYALF